MELTKEKRNNTLIISINGEIDGSNSGVLANYFKDLLPEQNKLIADFSKVEFISSAGLRVLLQTVKQTRKIGGDLKLSSVKANVHRVLDISGFTKILNVYPGKDEAVSSYDE